MVLTELFPAGTQVVSLPSRQHPRLILMGDTALKRWKASSLYPAYRFSAKGFRLLLRVKALLGIGADGMDHVGDWLVEEFVRNVFPKISSLVLLFGTPGPSQKLIIQIRDDANVIGYLKLAHSPIAQSRLEREHQMLVALPRGVGPEVLRFGEIKGRTGLLIAPIAGKPLSVRLPPPPVVWEFVESLQTSESLTIDSHPWIQGLRLLDRVKVDLWVEQLSRYKWPIAYQHGDLAPWNLLSTCRGRVVAIDWEYGTVQGFPYVDIVQYCLQVALLINKCPPREAKALAIRSLAQRLKSFSLSEVEALVNLSVFSAFKQEEQDGHSEHSHLQIWRRNVWMS
jgi:hypothetical protein